jgi:hypothetical protein
MAELGFVGGPTTSADRRGEGRPMVGWQAWPEGGGLPRRRKREGAGEQHEEVTP